MGGHQSRHPQPLPLRDPGRTRPRTLGLVVVATRPHPARAGPVPPPPRLRRDPAGSRRGGLVGGGGPRPRRGRLARSRPLVRRRLLRRHPALADAGHGLLPAGRAGPTPDGPTPDGSTPDGPTPDGPAPGRVARPDLGRGPAGRPGPQEPAAQDGRRTLPGLRAGESRGLGRPDLRPGLRSHDPVGGEGPRPTDRGGRRHRPRRRLRERAG